MARRNTCPHTSYRPQVPSTVGTKIADNTRNNRSHQHCVCTCGLPWSGLRTLVFHRASIPELRMQRECMVHIVHWMCCFFSETRAKNQPRFAVARAHLPCDVAKVAVHPAFHEFK